MIINPYEQTSYPSAHHTLSLAMLISFTLLLIGCDDETPSNDPSAGESTAGESTAGESTAGERTAGESTAGESPAGESPAGEEIVTPILPDLYPRESDGIEGAATLPLSPPEGLRVGLVDDPSEAFSGQDVSCRLGSIRLENEVITACIQGQYSLTQFKRQGGNLVDLMRWKALGHDGISEVLFAPGLGEVTPQEIKIVSDGSDGGPAIVQVVGQSEGSRILTSYLPGFVPRKMKITTEYHLYSGRSELEVHTWVEVGNRAISIQLADFVIWADQSQYFYPNKTGGRIPMPLSYIGSHIPKVSYLWRGLSVDKLRVLSLPDLPFQPVLTGQVEAPAGSILYVVRGLSVGEGGVTPIAEQRFEADPLAKRVKLIGIAGVDTQDHSLSAEVLEDLSLEIYTLSDNGAPETLVAQTRFNLDESGAPVADLSLPPGDYWVSAPEWIAPIDNQRLSVGAEQEDQSFNFSVPLPAKLSLSERFINLSQEPIEGMRGSKWIFSSQGSNHRIIHFVLGQNELSIPAGTWRVQVSRGWHFSLYDEVFTVSEGESRDLTVTLTEELPIPGWSAGEFHQHSAPSLDSEIAYRTRIQSNIVEGVGFMVPSDHDVMADYPRMVREMGYQDDIGAPITGLEISPRVGHLGAYGVEFRADDPNGAGGAPPLSIKVSDGVDGAPDVWTLRTIPELIQEARSRGAEVIQVNHPRDTTGYFDTVGFDPNTGVQPTDHVQWIADFDTVEVFNGANDLCAVMKDWQALLLQGERITAVGNSDSHGLGRPVGYPRNYLPTAARRAIDISREELVSALKLGRASIGGGAYLSLGGGIMWGDTLSGSSHPIELKAYSPSFTRLSRIRAFYNGQELWSRALSSERNALVDFEELIHLETPVDGFVIFFAEGPDLEAVHPGQPTFALSNPLWIDSDGDGVISLPQPYVAPADLVTPFCP